MNYFIENFINYPSNTSTEDSVEYAMEYDNNFIEFCESKEQEHTLDQYLRFLFSFKKNDSPFFDFLYDEYITEYSLEKSEKHYNLCKFYAFEYFYDFALTEDCYQDYPKNRIVYYH